MKNTHKQYNGLFKLGCIAALTLVGFAICLATQVDQSCPSANGQGTSPYIGTYYAIAKMTNSSGTYWITPPANTHTGTFKDASGFPSPYVSAVVVSRRSDGFAWYTNNNNSITFPATNSSYTLTVCVTSTTPPPTNGQPMTLQVTWQ